MRDKMAKLLTFNREKFTELLCCALCIFLIILISACGEGYYTSSETGSIAFSVEWRGAPQESSGRYAAALDCDAAGVATVEAKVHDENDSYLVGGGPWDCEAHQGTITGVPAGSNRKVAILGKGSSGNVLYWGEKTGITVIAGETNDAGIIEVSSFVPTNVSATPGDGQVTISWDTVSGATSYNIYWAKSAGVSKSTGTKISNASSPYTHTGLTNGTIYYYVVTAENSYGESDESSEVSATAGAERGELVAWGKNDHGQTNVPAGNDFVAIAGGSEHSLALRDNGSLRKLLPRIRWWQSSVLPL